MIEDLVIWVWNDEFQENIVVILDGVETLMFNLSI